MDLSETQRKDIRGTVRQYRGHLLDLREAVQRADNDLEIALNESPVDQRRANEAIDRLATARGELTRTLSQMTLRLRNILSNEQWQELQRRQAERERGSATGGCAAAALDRGRARRLLACGPGLEPAETVHGFSGGAILATDPAFVADLVEDLEQIYVVDLARIGLIARSGTPAIWMCSQRSAYFFQLGGDVALGDLDVVAVHLHSQVRSDGRAEFRRFGLGVEEEPRNVAGVDGFDHQNNPDGGELLGGIAQVGDIGVPAGGASGTGRDQSRHGVHARRFQVRRRK